MAASEKHQEQHHTASNKSEEYRISEVHSSFEWVYHPTWLDWSRHRAFLVRARGEFQWDPPGT